MYIPNQFKQTDQDILIDSIRKIKLGLLVIFSDNRFWTAHVPFLVKNSSESIWLECHVAKANEIWNVAHSANKAMVVFKGPHTYIHPGWYPAKAKTGKVVPTYNYHVIHCYGYCEKEVSQQWLVKHVQELTDENEKDQPIPWHTSDTPENFIQSLTKGIMGIKFYIEDIEGSLKMNQHHGEENRIGVIQNLSNSCKSQDQEVCKIMQDLEFDRAKKQ